MPDIVLYSTTLRLRAPGMTSGSSLIAGSTGSRFALRNIVVNSVSLKTLVAATTPTARLVRGGESLDDVNPTAHVLTDSVKIRAIHTTPSVGRFSKSAEQPDRGILSKEQKDNRAVTIEIDVSGPRVEAIEATAQWVTS